MNTTQFLFSAYNCGKKYLWMLFALAALASSSFGQTIPGTLSDTEKTTTFDNPDGCIQTTRSYTWTFTDTAGVTHPFPGVSDMITTTGSERWCLTGPQFGPLSTWSSDGLYYLQGTAGSATKETVTAEAGYVDPKYVVVGVTYAPPGPSVNTFVQYLKSTFVGNTESLSQSFTGTNTETVTLTYGFNIPLVANGKVTDTYSTTNSETTKTTSTVTTSIQVQNGEETFGTGNYFAPVDNDYDTVWVWLNPVAIFTIDAGVPLPVWNGYGFDGTDQSGMDIVGIQLGYLNGDFGTMPPDIQTSINRTWASDQVWPAGQGPALTSADLAHIASSDPFSVSTYGLDYVGYVPPSPSTSDNRFTLSLCSAESSFNYVQAAPSQTPAIYTCQLTYTNLSAQAQDISTSYSQTFSTDVAFTGSSFLKNLSAELKESSTLTWATDAQSSITTSTTSTASLSVQGPPCNNAVQGEGPCVPVYDSQGNQPVQFEVYQDNMYGTFMFAPVHYY